MRGPVKLLGNQGPGVYKPSPEDRTQVFTLSGLGITQVEIATLLKISIKTLRKHFRRELDTGATEANARVAQALYSNATKHMHVGAQIWWTKARMGWKDTTPIGGNADGKMLVEFKWADQPLGQPLIEASVEPVIDAQPLEDDDAAVEVRFAERSES